VVTNGGGSFTTSTLSVGTHPITATFAPATGSSFAASTSTPLNQIVNSPGGAQSFNFALSGPAFQTVIPGQSIIYNFALAPSSGMSLYPGTVTFTIAGCPSHAACSITPATVSANAGPQTEVLVVKTALPLTANTDSSPLARRGISIALVCLLTPMFLRRRIRNVRGSRLLVLLVLVGGCALGGALIGCGSGNGFFGEAPSISVITVTANSGAYSTSSQVTVNIQ
jgi:hypothetical protein